MKRCSAFGCALRALALLLAGSLPAAGATLNVLPGPGGPFDLPVAGMVAGVDPGQAAHVARADLLTLPLQTVDVAGHFGSKVKTARVVMLGDLIAALPHAPGVDVLLAACTDGYMSVYTSGFIRRYHPFLVLELDGVGPDHWPPAGLAYNPGPFAIDVSEAVAPGVGKYLDIAHKQPWAVVSIRLSSMAASFGGYYEGRWAHLSPAAVAGRELWINSCASCHAGPEGVAGGTKAGRSIEFVRAIAGADRKFFMQYVRAPTSLIPAAKMEPHPWYTDEQLDQLRAFITAGGPT